MKIGSYELQVPFVTTSSDSLKTIIDLADFQPGKKAIDLGSGDGRVALELAKHGFDVVGIEHNEDLVLRASSRAASLGLTSITFHTADFWNYDISPFDVLYIYGMGSIMGRLEKKLDNEMKKDARFISNIFHLPHWKVKKEKNSVNLYIKN